MKFGGELRSQRSCFGKFGKVTMDRRKTERYSLEIIANISASSLEDMEERTHVSLKTVDISSGGAFFKTSHPLPEGSKLEIELYLPLDQLKTIKGNRVRINVSGKVIRTMQEGMVVCFDDNYDIAKVSDV